MGVCVREMEVGDKKKVCGREMEMGGEVEGMCSEGGKKGTAKDEEMR